MAYSWCRRRVIRSDTDWTTAFGQCMKKFSCVGIGRLINLLFFEGVSSTTPCSEIVLNDNFKCFSLRAFDDVVLFCSENLTIHINQISEP
jgi:hypothetical protein